MRPACSASPFSFPVWIECAQEDLNPQPQPWQGCALPTELFPRFGSKCNHFRRRHLPPLAPRSGGEGDRTPDLVNAIHALSQLSYAPAILGPRKDRPAGTRHLIGVF